jgi:hypothetical protein
VPQVMESGLITGAIVAQHVSVYPQPAERVLGRGARETFAGTPDEYWSIGVCVVCVTTCKVLSQHVLQISADRNQP